MWATCTVSFLIAWFWITYRLPLKDTNIRTEPKHIVFLTKLLLLFRFCLTCKADNPLVQTREIGTEVIVKTTCTNPKCQHENTWYSQPLLPNSKIPAGNFLLCMATLLSGGSATRVFQIFRHMGLGCVSINTFFKYQRVSLKFVNYENDKFCLKAIRHKGTNHKELLKRLVKFSMLAFSLWIETNLKTMNHEQEIVITFL